jgi:hypothetical protein
MHPLRKAKKKAGLESLGAKKQNQKESDAGGRAVRQTEYPIRRIHHRHGS